MQLDLTDEQTTTLLRELDRIIDGDRYPFSPRMRTLKEIRAIMRPEPAREERSAAVCYEPPRAGRRRRDR